MSDLLATFRTRIRLRTRLRTLRFRLRWGFFPPPAWSDLSGYETLLRAIERHRIPTVEGDVVEIGAFLGGGTYQLCKLMERKAPGKRVYAIDVFDPSFDVAEDAYEVILGGRDQRGLYDDVTRTCRNLVTIAGDSAQVECPARRIAYAHIDGNHDPEYVRGDFALLWSRVSDGGIVSFDDYGYDLPSVTRAIDRLIEDHQLAIERVWTAGRKTIFLKKRAAIDVPPTSFGVAARESSSELDSRT